MKEKILDRCRIPVLVALLLLCSQEFIVILFTFIYITSTPLHVLDIFITESFDGVVFK
jgi:hypothetical protein